MKEKYSWEEIAQEQLILLERNSSSRLYLDKKFREKGIELEPQIEIAAHELLIQFASIHLGVSCVVREFSKEHIEKGLVRQMPLSPPLPERSIGYAHLRQSPLSMPAKAFLDMIDN